MQTDERELTAQLPPIGEAVWALFKDFWILAYLDSIGVWRTIAGDEPLKAPIDGMRTWLPRAWPPRP
jgi:hypothetical protein